MHNKKIWLTLIIVPFLTEMLSANSSIIELLNPLFLAIQIISYGFPILLIREVMIKWNIGLLGLFVLGFAYGFFNEGVIATTFAQTTTFLGETPITSFIFGLNPWWVIYVSIWHAFYAVIFPIFIIQYIYPENISWLSSKTIKWFIAVLIFGSLVSLFVGKEPQVIFSLICIPIFVWIASLFKKKYLTQIPQMISYKSFWFGFMFIFYTIFSIMLAKVLSFSVFLLVEIGGLLIFYYILKNKNLLSPVSMVLFAFGSYVSMAIFVSIILPSPLILVPNLLVIVYLIKLVRKIIRENREKIKELQLSL